MPLASSFDISNNGGRMTVQITLHFTCYCYSMKFISCNINRFRLNPFKICEKCYIANFIAFQLRCERNNYLWVNYIKHWYQLQLLLLHWFEWDASVFTLMAIYKISNWYGLFLYSYTFFASTLNTLNSYELKFSYHT